MSGKILEERVKVSSDPDNSDLVLRSSSTTDVEAKESVLIVQLGEAFLLKRDSGRRTGKSAKP